MSENHSIPIQNFVNLVNSENIPRPTEFQELDSSSSTRRLNLATREGRLQTFIDWPPSHPIQPLDLAEAGFYYTGKSYY